jgi:hypothetical protein
MGSISLFGHQLSRLGREEISYIASVGKKRQGTAKRDYPAVVYSLSNIWRRVVCQRYSQVFSVLGDD